jgi:hypothetical protein
MEHVAAESDRANYWLVLVLLFRLCLHSPYSLNFFARHSYVEKRVDLKRPM